MLAYPWWGGCDFGYFEGEIRPDPDPAYSGHLGLILAGGGTCDMAYFEGLASTGANTGDPVFGLTAMLAAGCGAGSSFGYFEGSASAQNTITQAPAGGILLDRGHVVFERGLVVIR
jgi:hypothetical protein